MTLYIRDHLALLEDRSKNYGEMNYLSFKEYLPFYFLRSKLTSFLTCSIFSSSRNNSWDLKLSWILLDNHCVGLWAMHCINKKVLIYPIGFKDLKVPSFYSFTIVPTLINWLGIKKLIDGKRVQFIDFLIGCCCWWTEKYLGGKKDWQPSSDWGMVTNTSHWVLGRVIHRDTFLL